MPPLERLAPNESLERRLEDCWFRESLKRPAFERPVPSRSVLVGDAYLELDLSPTFIFDPAFSRDRAAIALGELVNASGFPALYLVYKLPCEIAAYTWLFLLLAMPDDSIGERG